MAESSIIDVWQRPKSLMIRPKGEYQNWGNKKTKDAKFSKKHFLPLYIRTYDPYNLRFLIVTKCMFSDSKLFFHKKITAATNALLITLGNNFF